MTIALEDTLLKVTQAKEAYEEGRPFITIRHAVAYFIIAKLERHGHWGGEAKNKAFLWADDLPRGGFPSELQSKADKRKILDVADALQREGILVTKTSQSKVKYALGEKAKIERILETFEFEDHPAFKKFIAKDNQHITWRILTAETN